ncbi:GvpL/GvpF family gas vesicle protein [Streptomyces sp. NPDC048018]|uniref:GvpL/GvpF family gas vesicle protein n=1 Tax=Streptomyces sp. NPDC048018 TaxID=3365499 RepID=UPI0037247FC0
MSTYVYGITAAGHPLRLDGVLGVGEPAAPLRTVRSGTLIAVVSDAPPGLRAKRRDVQAHQGVVEALMLDGATLPMRFGLLAPGDAEVASALDAEGENYLARLEDLEGHVEYHLKVSREEDDLLREVIEESEPIRELRERTRDGAGTHEERLELGELVSAEVTARQDAEAQRLVEALSSRAKRVSVGEPTASSLLSVSFLVPSPDMEGFVAAVQEQADRRGDAYGFTLTGPLPPYSFV